MAVKFLTAHTVGTCYAPGEIAGFERGIEDDLVKRKIAEPLSGKKPEEPKHPAK